LSSLLVIGAGGHGKVVADAALLAGWSSVAFADDRLGQLGSPLGLAVVSTLHRIEGQAGKHCAAIVAVGDAQLRLELLRRCRAAGFELATVIHPRAAVSTFAELGAGCVILAQAAVNAGARLGMGCIVNTGATVDHDCVLGDGVHVCPGAHLGGDVRAADRAWIGIGAAVRHGISIGRDVTIGAGAAVVADAPDGATLLGVPAKQKGSTN
jgi:sugar O-acyltransferase (sialic acid O-acetyltransferase NeuD family)